MYKRQPQPSPNILSWTLKIPTGELALVHGTAFDFSEERPLGTAIDDIGGDPPGLDHCLVCVGTQDDGQAEVMLELRAAAFQSIRLLRDVSRETQVHCDVSVFRCTARFVFEQCLFFACLRTQANPSLNCRAEPTICAALVFPSALHLVMKVGRSHEEVTTRKNKELLRLRSELFDS